MNADETPFGAGWWSVDLGKYRECDSTYCYFDYATLPPLDMSLFGDEFQWLEELDAGLSGTMEVHRPPDEIQQARLKALDKLVQEAQTLGLTLPVAFLKFMGSLKLQNEIPSCTACYFDLPRRIVRSPFGDDGYLIRFLNDQQDVLLWYLYVKPGGEHCVIASDVMYDAIDFEVADVSLERLKAYTLYTAPTFEAFIYRFWIENRIWFALNEDERDLSEAEKKYLEHYKKDT